MKQSHFMMPSMGSLQAAFRMNDMLEASKSLSVAQRWIRDNQYAQALEPLEEAQRLSPQDPAVPKLQAECHEKLGNTDEARAAYLRALALQPENARSRIKLGFLEQKAGNHQLSRTLLEEGLSLLQDRDDPRGLDMSYLKSEAWHYLGHSYKREGDLDTALSCFEEANRCNPRHVRSMTQIAHILTDCGEEALALEWLCKAEKIEPDNPHLHLAFGKAFTIQGDYDLAEQHLVRSLELAPEAPYTLNSLGYLRYMQNRLPEAEALYRRVLVVEPNSDSALTGLADVYLKQKKPDQAMRCADTLLSIHPDDETALRQKGSALFRMGRYTESLDVMLHADRVQPDTEYTLDTLTRIYLHLGDVDTAEQTLLRLEAVAREEDQERISVLWDGITAHRLERILQKHSLTL